MRSEKWRRDGASTERQAPAKAIQWLRLLATVQPDLDAIASGVAVQQFTKAPDELAQGAAGIREVEQFDGD